MDLVKVMIIISLRVFGIQYMIITNDKIRRRSTSRIMKVALFAGISTATPPLPAICSVTMMIRDRIPKVV